MYFKALFDRFLFRKQVSPVSDECILQLIDTFSSTELEKENQVSRSRYFILLLRRTDILLV